MSKNRLNFHLMPPQGWMNDPNGLCYYQGYYHVFFQYSPDEVEGGKKYWGHYRSENLLNWEYVGITIKPDIPEDSNGAFSGCAFVEDGKLELFYTGDVIEEGDYDYIHEGREENVIYLCSEDGIHFSEKEVILRQKDYPKDCTGHVRDPKVWKEDGTYYMVLGARKVASDEREDYGSILLYRSKDKKVWEYQSEFYSSTYFGYMWECPDYFCIEGKPVLSTCPQGIPVEEYRFFNKDLSGYFLTKPISAYEGSIEKEDWMKKDFLEWDSGFEFYAPQTFLDAKGRRILIGWAGIPYPEYTNNATIKEGWQHCLTVPREITIGETGDLLQNPVEEIKELRVRKIVAGTSVTEIACKAFDAEFAFVDAAEEKSIVLADDLELSFKDGVIELAFKNNTGEGRGSRKIKADEFRNLRMLKDTSMVEYYINDGAYVFTTRYYPESVDYTVLKVQGQIEKSEIWEMGSFYE